MLQLSLMFYQFPVIYDNKKIYKWLSVCNEYSKVWVNERMSEWANGGALERSSCMQVISQKMPYIYVHYVYMIYITLHDCASRCNAFESSVELSRSTRLRHLNVYEKVNLCALHVLRSFPTSSSVWPPQSVACGSNRNTCLECANSSRITMLHIVRVECIRDVRVRVEVRVRVLAHACAPAITFFIINHTNIFCFSPILVHSSSLYFLFNE